MDCTTDPEKPTCKSSYTPKPDNNCNGIDDDCDGKIDDGYVPTAAQGTPTGCPTTFKAPGLYYCLPGGSPSDHLVFESKEDQDYCDKCDDSDKCGFCYGDQCIPGSDVCAPGYVCKDGPTAGCNTGSAGVTCYSVYNVDGCSPCSHSCWLPGSLKAGLNNATCPN